MTAASNQSPEQQSERFDMFKQFVFEDDRLRTTHRFALLIMRNASNGPDKEAYMSNTSLAKIMGVNRETANRLVADLKKLGYLKATTNVRHKAIHYKVNLNPPRPEAEKLSTGVMTASHLNEIHIENRCDSRRTPGVIDDAHLCDPRRTPMCATTHTNLTEYNLIEEEFKENPFLEKDQIQTHKSKDMLARQPGDPSFGAQQTHHQNAKRLGIPPKGDNEGWTEFRARIRIAQKTVIQGGIVCV